jgi:uncharacterized protein YqhQ
LNNENSINTENNINTENDTNTENTINPENIPTEKKKSKIGGQAVIEGVMMKGLHKSAMACRLPDGTLDLEVWDDENVNVPWFRKCPFIRGIFNFVFSLKDGYKCLIKSSNKQIEFEEAQGEDDEEVSKFEQWLLDHMGKAFTTVVMVIAMIIGVALSMFLFIFVPTALCGLIPYLQDHRELRTLCEGLLKIVVFISYIGLTALMKDIRRTYEYHGAEHKTIACYEAGEELTVENVRKHSRFHPRCGTSFIFITLTISILVFCLIQFDSTWMRVLLKFPLLIPTVCISYEFIRLAGRSSNKFTRALSAPGLALQKLTTREPDDSQIECAIAAMQPCIPENADEDKW